MSIPSCSTDNSRNSFEKEGPKAKKPEATGGLRHRVSKMVPRISAEFSMDKHLEDSYQARNGSFSQTRKESSKGSENGITNSNGPPIMVQFQHPLDHNPVMREVLFDEQSRGSLDSLSDLKSPVDDVSLSSDDSHPFRTTSFNSRNLYESANNENEFDDIAEESMLLPDADFTRIRERNREINIKVGTEQKSLIIALQVFLPFMVAGMGTVAAGLLLDVVQVIAASFQNNKES